jgi:Domain of Unknown Function (DUF928)
MAKRNFQKLWLCLTSSLLLQGLILLETGSLSQAHSHSSGSLSGGQIFDPPDEGIPDRTASGGSRGTCPQDLAAVQNRQGIHQLAHLTALVPEQQTGLTISGHPTFFVYTPATSAQELFFILRDEEGTYHYETILPISGDPGVEQFTLPETEAELEVGKTYYWAFALVCSDRIRPDSPIAQSYIQRIELNSTLAQQLQSMSPLEQVALYRQEGIWYDMLGILADLWRSQPNDTTISTRWVESLESVGLEEIATQPLTHQN